MCREYLESFIESLKESEVSILEKILRNKKVRTTIATVLGIALYCEKVFAAGDSADFWQVVRWGQDGLFWLGMFIALFGLYLTLLKKDDAGKKLIWTSFLVYIGSYAIPKAYVMLRAMLQKL